MTNCFKFFSLLQLYKLHLLNAFAILIFEQSIQDQPGEWFPFQAEGGTAYAHSTTGEVCWTIPAGGVEGHHTWVPFETEDGFVAYKNQSTGQVSWENPDDAEGIGGGIDMEVNDSKMMSNPMGHRVSDTRLDIKL